MTTTPLSARPTRERLLALAGTEALRARSRTYLGDTNTIRLSEIPPGDADTLRRIYTFLVDVRALVEPRVGAGQDGLDVLRDEIPEDELAAVVAAAGTLGGQLHAADVRADVKQAYHDVRGGSLMALLMHLDLVLEGEGMPDDVERIFLLCRDHLKMMRNAVPDLDPELYAADLDERDHSVSLLREKWTGVAYPLPGHAVRVELVCDFEGSISQRCMEFSALDRVIYNLVNNAAKYAVDSIVQLHVLPVDDRDDTHLRFAVANRIAPAQRTALLARFGEDGLDTLYEGGFTTGGHGIGMRICGDFVTHGYGLSSLREALTGEYLGIDLIDDHFVAWFHWPARREADGARVSA